MRPIGGTYTLNSGYEIPLIGFGTYQIKGQETISKAIDAALAAGYRLIDTAARYQNEKEIGIALQEFMPKYNLKRSNLFITTKITLALDKNTEATRKTIEESLKFLQTDYLDLVLIHYPRSWVEGGKDDSPNNPTCRKEAYLELEKLKREGKIRSIGVSNFEIRHIEELKNYSTIPPAVNQCEYHPHFARNELLDYCNFKENIFFQAFTSLGRQEPALVNDPVVVSLAQKHKTSVNLVLLAYALVQGIGILPKSVTPSRIHENIGVVKVKLTTEEVEQLRALDQNKNYTLCQGWNVL